MIVSGALSAGEKLPSIRELARQLKINPTTVTRIYGELAHHGIITLRQGQGPSFRSRGRRWPPRRFAVSWPTRPARCSSRACDWAWTKTLSMKSSLTSFERCGAGPFVRLSKGQQRKTCILLALCQNAELIVVDVHKMTLTKLPAFELYEEGSQIRRSIKSVKSNIVEGYGRRRYKQEYIRFLTFSLASCDETTDHLETVYETGSLKDEPLYKNLHQRLQTLGKKINRFIQSVEREHRTEA